MDCLFCKIVNKEIGSDIVFENEQLIAFNDIDPQAPFHILILPKKHYKNINELYDADLYAHIMKAAVKIANDKGFAEAGYRIVVNCNNDGGQSVDHVHFHLLGGRKLNWPPG